MIVDSRVFDGTRLNWVEIVAWIGDRVPYYEQNSDGITRMAVANPGSDMIQWAEPGDTIELHDDGLLVVMPAGIAERTVHIRPRDMI